MLGILQDFSRNCLCKLGLKISPIQQFKLYPDALYEKSDRSRKALIQAMARHTFFPTGRVFCFEHIGVKISNDLLAGKC